MIEVPPIGPLGASLAVIGEAPGIEETLRKPPEPFVGRSGKMLDEALGGGRGGTYITNVRKVLPPRRESKKQKVASLLEWRPQLEAEMRTLGGCRTLALVGADAMTAVLGMGRVSLYHGSVLTRREVEEIRKVGSSIVPTIPLPPQLHSIIITLHPAFALHGKPQFRPFIKSVLGRASRWALAEDGPTRPHDGINLTPTVDETDRLLMDADLAGAPVVIDVETPMDNGSHIDLCGVSAGGRVHVFPWTTEHQHLIRDWARQPGVMVGHNISFDLKALAAYGIRPGPKRKVVDTIVAGALLWPPNKEVKKTRWLALSTCVMRVLDGVGYWKTVPRKNKPPILTFRDAMYRASWPMLAEWQYPRLYCALDCLYTGRLWAAQRQLLQTEQML